MDDGADPEQSDEDTVRSEIRSILEKTLLDTAFSQIAFTPASGRHCCRFGNDADETKAFWRSDDG